MISSIFSFEIISIAISLLKIFFWIAVSVAVAATVNPNGIKTLLTYSFFINGKPAFSNGSKTLPENPPNWPILDNWVFDNFILADKSFSKVLQSLETCVSVNNNLCRKLVSSLESPATFDGRFKVTAVPFFIPDFNLLSYELEKFTFKVLYWVILYWYYFKAK